MTADRTQNELLCECTEPHPEKRIVLTGGPGAGKTAVLELIRKSFCQHVRVLPEAASVVFGGGFPRESSVGSRQAAQRAIFHVQRELERLDGPGGTPAIMLCDRGTLDGLAYWPGAPQELLAAAGTDRAAELARYAAVIHLRTPSVAGGYNHQNALRTESAEQAAALDERIADAWLGHPRRFFVESQESFLTKAAQALALLRDQLPACCRAHRVPGLEPLA